MKPTVSRILMYYPHDGRAPIPAIVCGTDPSRSDDTLLHLTLFDPLHGPSVIRNLPISQEGHAPGCWAWPERPAASAPPEM